MHSPDEAFAFLTELRKLVRWINVCDGNMEEGSMRCDANISVRLKGETKLGTRVEVKNLNSIRNVKKAIELEVERLIELTEKGETILQQTRSFDADKLITFALRSKEEADDYRYFPEPDLPAFFISDAYIKNVAAQLPILPLALEQHYKESYGLTEYDAAILCSDREQADFFESIISHCTHYKAVANWIQGPVKAWCNEHDSSVPSFPLAPAAIAALVNFTESGKISFNIASSRVLPAMIEAGENDPLKVATSLNLLQESDEDAVAAWVKEVLAGMPDKVTEFKSGKKNLLGLFAGQVKKISKGKADMQLVNKILNAELNN
jgi:aspartyl-tRNA(Asn)/glutamyl-tRNA(Gln) amidotransferase subunit B